jgi:hypothetical protein
MWVVPSLQNRGEMLCCWPRARKTSLFTLLKELVLFTIRVYLLEDNSLSSINDCVVNIHIRNTRTRFTRQLLIGRHDRIILRWINLGSRSKLPSNCNSAGVLASGSFRSSASKMRFNPAHSSDLSQGVTAARLSLTSWPCCIRWQAACRRVSECLTT